MATRPCHYEGMDGNTEIERLHALFAAGALADARTAAETLLQCEPRHAEALHVLGLICYRGGRFADSIVLLEQSLELSPQAATWSNLAAALRASGQADRAEAACRHALALQPDLADASWNLANLLIAAERLEEAASVLTQAIEQQPRVLNLQRKLGGILQALGRYAAAAQIWREVMAAAPEDSESALNLARCLHAAGDKAGAETILLHVPNDDPRVLSLLGLVLAAQAKLHEADESFARCLAIAPTLAPVWAAWSDVLRRLGRMPAAETAARHAVTIDPRCVDGAVNLGNALAGQYRHEEAEAAFDLALSLQPDSAEAFNGRGLARLRRGAVVSAEADFRKVLQFRPDLAMVGTNLAIALLDQGRPAAALDAAREACVRSPGVAAARRTLLFCLNYQPDLSAEAIFAEYQAQAARSLPVSPRSDRIPGRRLRIGYVSPDFRAQSASLFIKPLLAAHDRSTVELFCYAELPHHDAATEQLRSLADHWQPTVGMSDAEVADMIRTDRIDVLIDMGGYSTNSRVDVFALKPAPVQVEYLLGHGSTSGLATMDAFLADTRLAPPGCDHLFSERVVRLDRIPLAYEPPASMPAVGPLPAKTRGYITFGHFGRTARIHAGVIAAWSRILGRVAKSRLVLNSAPFAEPAFRQAVLDRFRECEVEPHRLDLVYTSPQSETFKAYGEIDIALDPFPHNAGTTTIEALWRGVPVVSLKDRPPVGRFGASILHAIGLDGWATSDLDAYVACAVHAATDLDRLARLRASLWDRCMTSPLHDAAGLARTLESVYRELADQ